MLSPSFPYRGTDLSEFNGARTRPWGYVELMVTYGEEELSKTVKTQFLDLPCNSPYQCIIGRPTLGRLGSVALTVHLKMKFYSQKDEVVKIAANLVAAKRCNYLSIKSDQKTEKEQARAACKS